jgi:ribosomal protein S18 acetylase RimI-like enzyme
LPAIGVFVPNSGDGTVSRIDPVRNKVEVDESTFAYIVGALDLDLEQSLVAEDDGTPVGLANLGRRGRRTWLGGVGVVRSKRREGLGELLIRSLLDRAHALGATEITLEVIVENEPAIGLYEKVGFVRAREQQGAVYTRSSRLCRRKGPCRW